MIGFTERYSVSLYIAINMIQTITLPSSLLDDIYREDKISYIKTLTDSTGILICSTNLSRTFFFKRQKGMLISWAFNKNQSK